MDRQSSYELMCEYTTSDSLRRHMLAVETAMAASARRLGENELVWRVTGLLHDFDYEKWPEPPDHPLQGSRILAEHGYPDEIIYAIKSHVDAVEEAPRRSLLDRALFACDELCGFITACAYVRPDGIHGLTARSVLKKMKQKSFAANVNRDDIVGGAREFGVELADHIQFVIDALAAEAEMLRLAGVPRSAAPDRSVNPSLEESLMSTQVQSREQLGEKKCVPCEGGVEACPLPQARDQVARLPGWSLTHDGKRIRKDWRVKNFVAGMDFFNRVAELAESEGHHPDVHLENYRDAWIEIWTHAIGGLSENDFILAAKIDRLEVTK